MELNKLSLALAASLVSFSALADTAPVPQVIDADHHHSHESDDHDDNIDTGPSQERAITINPQPQVMTFSVQAVAECDVSSFATSNSQTLINELKTQGAECVNDLFSADNQTQIDAFSSKNMYYVAKHATELLESTQERAVMSWKRYSSICVQVSTPSFITMASALHLGSQQR